MKEILYPSIPKILVTLVLFVFFIPIFQVACENSNAMSSTFEYLVIYSSSLCSIAEVLYVNAALGLVLIYLASCIAVTYVPFMMRKQGK